MATTRIMPLHVGKGRTESRAISDIIDYVVNPQKTDNGKLITDYACDSRTADTEFLLAKRQYIAATGRVRGADDVITYHVRQSFRPGEITQEEANRLGDQAKPSHRKLLRVAIDNALSQSPADFEELLKLLQEYGCESLKARKIVSTEALWLGESRPHGQSGRRIWIGRFAGSSLRAESTYPAKENSHTGRVAKGQSAGVCGFGRKGCGCHGTLQ